METWLASWLASTLLVIALARLKLFIAFSYRRRDSDDQLRIDVYTLKKLIVYHLEIPLARLAKRGGLPWPEAVVDTPGGRTETHAKAEQRFVRNTWRIFRHHPRHWHYLMQQMRFWRTGLGTGDAALTGLATGLIWQLKGQIYSYMQRRLKSVARPALGVSPLFAREGLEIELECIFSIRLGNVINAIATAIRHLGKGDTGSGRAPDPKSDENSHGKHQRHG